MSHRLAKSYPLPDLTPSRRDTIFISHANPEDNEFARWLTLRLTSLGYTVWCDLTRLLGGEDFWERIEEAIRTRTSKVLFLLSRASNHKPGTLNELQAALTVERSDRLLEFIIPLRVDDLPYSEVNIQLARRNAIDFSQGWHRGMTQLLAKLDEDGIAKPESEGSRRVRDWWTATQSGNGSLVPEIDPHSSNWFRLELPETLHFHALTRDSVGLVEPPKETPFPARWEHDRWISFASAAELTVNLAPLQVAGTYSTPTATALAEPALRHSMTALLNDAWDRHILHRGLGTFEMANRQRAFYFDKKSLPAEDVTFTSPAGKKSMRALRGYKTVPSGSRRYWHFGGSARAQLSQMPVLMVRSHVFFSDDEQTLWASPERMHRARRSQCKNWWNDDWRDRLLAAMRWLGDESASIELPVSGLCPARVSTLPVVFNSPVSWHGAPDLEPATSDSDEDETPEEVE